jgi:hypothetical protein
LSNQQGSTNTNPPSDAPFFPIWPNGVAKIKRHLHKRRADHQKESPQDRFARRTATATVWIAIFAVISATVGLLQYCSISGQLDEMRAEQRPWINFSATAGSDMTLGSGGIVALVAHTALTNIGHLPAQNVVAHAALVPWAEAAKQAKRRDLICSELKYRRITPANQGFVLFPNETKQPPLPLGLTKENFEEWHGSGEPLVLIGCLDYVFLTNGSHHHVGFIFEIDKRGAAPESVEKIVPDETVPMAKVIFNINPTLPWDID